MKVSVLNREARHFKKYTHPEAHIEISGTDYGYRGLIIVEEIEPYLILKWPGQGVWNGQGMGQRYAESSYFLALVLKDKVKLLYQAKGYSKKWRQAIAGLKAKMLELPKDYAGQLAAIDKQKEVDDAKWQADQQAYYERMSKLYSNHFAVMRNKLCLKEAIVDYKNMRYVDGDMEVSITLKWNGK